MAKRLKKKTKKTKTPAVRTERAKVKTETVASPWNNGFDKIKRVVDTISDMQKRHQLNELQAAAAKRCREAYEACHGSIKSPLDDSNLSGGSPGSRTPTPRMLWASGILREVRDRCGETETALIVLIACRGESIQDVTAMMYGKGQDGKCNADDLRFVGKQFRHALDKLARRWFGTEKRTEHESFLPDWARPVNLVRDGEIAKTANAATLGYDKDGKFKVDRSRGR